MYYILKDKKVVRCDNILEWGWWMEKNRHTLRVVKQEYIGDVLVSTVFLGVDHNHWGGEPILFETMVFTTRYPELDMTMCRYRTWEEAEIGHAAFVQHVKDELQRLHSPMETLTLNELRSILGAGTDGVAIKFNGEGGIEPSQN